VNKQVLDVVLSYPKIVTRLKERPHDLEKIERIVAEVHGEFSPRLVSTVSKLVESTFLKLYDGLSLEMKTPLNMKQATQDYHVVLVPNHQSHADYVALTYLMWKHFALPVYVAGGINLNIFPIGPLFRKSGAFFIRRSFQSDIVYRLTFEAYIFYLLKSGWMVEFFFEGGRTRTGKLMPPRYGLFQMLLEAHAYLNDGKSLLFIPVAIAHEVIPEAKAHARELEGGKKAPEKTSQLLKLFQLVNKKLGTIHVCLGEPIEVPGYIGELKYATQELAFECFKSVGKTMPITPSALLAMILLDEPAGALTWSHVEQKATDIRHYCLQLNIPLTQSLREENYLQALNLALHTFLNNGKVDVIKREKLNMIFYAVKKEARVEILYHKNMILHHFIVPAFINATWFNLFKGQIKDSLGLTKFLMAKRKELKYEFYLPTVKEMIHHALSVVEWALGKKLKTIDEALSFTSQELYELASKVRPFSTAFTYMYETYYIATMSLKYLHKEPFGRDKFITVAKELFEIELEHGRVIKYPEAFTVPILQTTLEYFLNQKVLRKVEGKFEVIELQRVERMSEKFLNELNDQVKIRFQHTR
jgi:glycerol-3-phosphate O-acyltransferase